MTYSKKPLFNLSLVIKETGIKADTIRAWERRYKLPQPARSSGGQRLYSEYDLQILLWLLERQKEGMRIGQAAAYWRELTNEGTDPLAPKVEHSQSSTVEFSSGANENLEDLQDQWLKYCFLFDEANAERILDQAFTQFPAGAVCGEMILPGLRQVGELWVEGEISVQQEHFISEIAARKLQSLISSAPNPVHKQRILLGSPPGENHVIGLLMMALLLKNRGWPIIYLGGNVPLQDLINTVQDSHVDLAVMSASRLVTSASLLEAIRVVAKNGTPVAFSGWIFSQSEDLDKQIPGLYLGNDLNQALNKVEEFLNDPKPLAAADHPGEPNDRLIQDFHESASRINQMVLSRWESDKMGFSRNAIIKANIDLTADIAAALELGDIKYLRPNLEWASRLLINRNFSETSFRDYLSIYTEVLEEILGDEANTILSLIKKFSRSTSG